MQDKKTHYLIVSLTTRKKLLKLELPYLSAIMHRSIYSNPYKIPLKEKDLKI